MIFTSRMKIMGLTLALILTSLPAFSFVERCEILFTRYVVPSARDLRNLVVRFEITQVQKHGGAITAIEGEVVLRQIERAIHAAKLEDLLPFFEPETGLTPFMHHDPKLRDAVARSIYNHPSRAAERALFLRKIISENIDFDFFDEIIGLNKDLLENTEDDVFQATKDPQQRSSLLKLGFNQGHDQWFSDHLTLIGTLESARKLGVRKIVDLGSGTGRLGLLAGLLFPDIQVIGLEIYGPRVAAAQEAAARWGFQTRIQFRTQDLLDPQQSIPEADYYFILGPTTDVDINTRVIERLRQNTIGKKIIVSGHHPSTLRILHTQSQWLYKLNSNDISDGTLYTNTPLSEWLVTLKRNLAEEAATSARRKPEKTN